MSISAIHFSSYLWVSSAPATPSQLPHCRQHGGSVLLCSPVPTSKAPRFRLVALFSPLPIATRHPHCTRLLHYRQNLQERVSLTPTASSLLLSLLLLCLTHFFHGSPRHPSNSPTTSSPDRTHRFRRTGRGLQGKSSRGYAVYAHFGSFGSAILSSGLDSLLSAQRGYLKRCSIGPDCPACVREFSKSGPAQQVGALLGSGVSTACRCVGAGDISSSRSSGSRIHRGFESPLPFAGTHAAAHPDTLQW